MTDLWLENIEPNLAPGGMYIRTATESGHLLNAQALENVSEDGGEAAAKAARIAGDWLDAHPADEVRTHFYCGNTGVCICTIVEVGCQHKRREPNR